MASVSKLLDTRALRPLKDRVLVPAAEGVGRAVLERKLQSAPLDPGIRYPSYKSFDDMIDVERLKSLDEYVTSKIAEHNKEHDPVFGTGPMTLKATSPKQTGSRNILLSKKIVRTGYLDYYDLDNPDNWAISEEADEFSLLMDFIATLPFKSTTRMVIFYDLGGHVVTPHRDHPSTERCHEFLWFRTNLSKPFYMLNAKTGEKLYVDTYSAWFDTVNQFHGADAYGGLSFSIRVDGTFTDEFRKRIPEPTCNRASTPSLWASIS